MHWQAPWSEFDLGNRLWTPPPERMKGGREHRVPLPDTALAILAKQAAIRTNDYVFPDAYGAKHVGTHLLQQTLKRRAQRSDRAWLSLDLLRLVLRGSQLPQRGQRDGTRPQDQERSRGGLPAW